MSYHHHKSRYFALLFSLAVLSGIILCGFTQVARAGERELSSGRKTILRPQEARAGERGVGRQEFKDSRYGHDHAYPERGQYVEGLPSGYRAVVYGKSRYYFNEGVWYRPEGRRFVIIAPPFGLIVPFLPLYYTTLWVGGLPYYYANDVYYTHGAGGYVIVEPPKGEISQAPPSAVHTSLDQLFIYPRQGQNEQQQAKDRYECHSWAVSQTGYDPTQPPAAVPTAQISQKRADYQRAMGACLEGRGYTVK